jgi:hypothetical protein
VSRFWGLWAHLIGYMGGSARQVRAIQMAPLSTLLSVGTGGGRLAVACQEEIGRRFLRPVLQTLLDNGVSEDSAERTGYLLIRRSINSMSAQSAREFSLRLWTLLASQDAGRCRDRQGTSFFLIQFLHDTPAAHHRVLEWVIGTTPGADATSSLGLSGEKLEEALRRARKALCRVMCAVPNVDLAHRTLDYWTQVAVGKDICGGKCHGIR